MSQEQRPINIEPISSDVDLEGMTKALVNYCDSFGISISIEAARRCIEHFIYVIQVNQVINLTRITDIDEGIVLHILDSLMFLPSLNLHPSEHVLDMGTGAGYPGLPLAATSNADVVILTWKTPMPYTLVSRITRARTPLPSAVLSLGLSRPSVFFSSMRLLFSRKMAGLLFLRLL